MKSEGERMALKSGTLQNSTKLLEFEASLASGKSIEFNPLSSDDRALVQHLLRHYRHQNLHLANDEHDVQVLIENIRNHIKEGNRSAAGVLLNSVRVTDVRDSSLRAELLLEWTRYQALVGETSKALEHSSLALIEFGCADLTKMTLHQIRADLYLRLGDLLSAQEAAASAERLAHRFPICSSRYSNLGFLAVTLARLGEAESSLKVLEELRLLVDRLEQDAIWLDRLLILKRSEFRVHQDLGNGPAALAKLTEAELLAEFLGQHELQERCGEDRKRLEASALTERPYLTQGSLTLFADDGLLLNWQSREFHRLESTSTQVRILRQVFRGELAPAVIFEAVWGMRYNKETHGPLIRNHLSQLRKKIPGLHEALSEIKARATR